MQWHRPVGEVNGRAATSTLGIERMLWPNERGDVGYRVVDLETVCVERHRNRLVEVHRPRRVDRDQRNVAAVNTLGGVCVDRVLRLVERGFAVVLADPQLGADRLEVDIGGGESALHTLDTIADRALQTADCAPRTVDWAPLTVDWALQTVDCALQSADCAPHTVDWALHTVDCACWMPVPAG
ncbi:Uncharacterised protein [Mycobacteroides abscessus subsp. abscessus]|nr:Uncharacterised protein [Mycobacteroides abscessus subsp. abscessus]